MRVFDPRSGRQTEKTFYGSYEAAVRELATMNAEVAALAAPAVPHARTVTVGYWIPEWLEMYAWVVPPSRNGKFPAVQRPFSTWSKAKRMCEGHLLDDLGETTKLSAVTYDDLVDLISSLTLLDKHGNPTDKPMAARSKSTAADVLRAMFRDAVKAGILARSPAAKLPTHWSSAPTSRTALIPSIRDVETLAEAMDKSWPLPKWAADLYGPNGEGRGDLVRVLAYTGMRISELFAMPVELVTPKRRTAWMRDTVTESGGRRQYRMNKGKSDAAIRHLILVDQALPALRRLNAVRKRGLELEPARQARREARRKREDARAAAVGRQLKARRTPEVERWTLLVCGEEGGFQSYGHWRKKLEVAQDISGVTYDAHSLRHVAASILYAAGEDARVIREQMGHKSERTTEQVYRHMFAVDHTEVARRVSAKIAAITEAERAAAEAELAEEGAPALADIDPDDDW